RVETSIIHPILVRLDTLEHHAKWRICDPHSQEKGPQKEYGREIETVPPGKRHTKETRHRHAAPISKEAIQNTWVIAGHTQPRLTICDGGQNRVGEIVA